MHTQQLGILKLLDAYVWERVDTDHVEREWWADEIWGLQSVWVPRECQVYLSFLVDPQDIREERKKGEHAWCVSAHLYESSRMGETILTIKQGWKERLPEFFAGLAKLRAEWMR